MTADPFGLGELLYGVRPARVLTAAAWAVGPLAEREFELAHAGCSISTFCRNPLHPGPCKGWKKSLGANAPGALKAIEAARKEKLAQKRAATSEAKSAAAKGLNARQLASPLHAKKATIKNANILLGQDEAKAGGKADKVILNKAEIKKYSKIKAAQMNSVRAKHGLAEDPGMEDRLAEALAKDNVAGKDDNYRAAIRGSAESLGAQLAQKHCKKGDGDCDGKPYEELRDEFTAAAEAALLTGGGDIDTLIEDYDAGDFKPAGIAEAKKIAAEMDEAKQAKAAEEAPEPALKKGEQTIGDMFDAAKDAAPGAVLGKWQYKKDGQVKGSYEYRKGADGKVEVWAKPAGMPGFAKIAAWKSPEEMHEAAKNTKSGPGMVTGVPGVVSPEMTIPDVINKPPAKAKAKTAAPLEGNALLADKGMKFGLGLSAFVKGKKTLGTKAAQKEFADKIEAHLNGDESKANTIEQGANILAGAVQLKAKVHIPDDDARKAIGATLETEIAAGLKGEDGPFPMVDAFKKAIDAHTVLEMAQAQKAILALHKTGKGLNPDGEPSAAAPDESAEKVLADVEQALSAGNVPDPQGMAKKMMATLKDKKKNELFIPKAASDKMESQLADELAQASGPSSPTPTLDQWKKLLAEEPSSAGGPDIADVQTAMNAPAAKPWTPQDEYLNHAKAVIAGKYDNQPQQTIGLAGLLTPDQFENDLTPEERQALLDKLQAAHAATPSEALKDSAEVTYKKLTGDPMPEPDILQQLLDAVPMSTGHNEQQQKAIDATNSMILDSEALAAYDGLTKADFDGLDPLDQKAVLNDLETIAKKPPINEGDAAQAKAVTAKLTGAPSSKFLGGVSVPLLKEAFGPDGDPNHQEAVHLINTMNPLQWDQLDPQEKSYAADHIDDAAQAGEPGADAAVAKLKNLGQPVGGPPPPSLATLLTPPGGKLAADVSPEAKAASDYAHGFKSGTAKQKLPAYEKLSGEEFAQLKPETQKLILADLKSIEDKFLAPGKKKQASDQHNYLSGFMGGGAGAGGGGNPGVNPDDKLAKALADLPALSQITLPPGAVSPPGWEKQVQDAFEGLVQSSSQDKAAKFMAPVWADNGLKKLAAMHADPFGASYIEDSALAAAAPALADDIAKKMKGEPGPTPHLDAFTKAISYGGEQDASDFLSGAAGLGVGGSSTVGAPPSFDEQQKIVDNVHSLWTDALDGGAKSPGKGMLAGQVNSATAVGVGSPIYNDFADTQANLMAMVTVSGGMGKVGITTPGDVMALMDAPDFKTIQNAMAAELATAIKTGKSSAPTGGVTKKFHAAVAEVQQVGDDLAAKNGWDPDGDAVANFKHALLNSKIAELAATVPASPPAHTGGGSGAGGATPASTGLGPVVTTAPPVSGVPGGAPIGTGTGISHIPLSKQQEILGDLKGLPTGKYLSDPKDVTYGNLLALAAAHGTADEPLSVMQVLQSIDNAFSKQLNVSNINKWENEFVDWLKTPDGAAFAAANPNADANLVKKFQGVYDGPSTDLVELSKKVKLLPGPGAYDPGKPSSDFKQISTSHAEGLAKQMFASSPGGWMSADEKSGVYTYTGGSYATMNGWLRGEIGSDPGPTYKKAIKDAQAAMRPVPEDILVHRGTGWDQLPEGFRSAAGAKKLIGKTIMDEAFLSTSVGGTAAFGGPLLLEIEVPKGAYAVYASGKHPDGSQVSQHPGEREMLLAAGSHYQVLSVTEQGGQTVVRMRVVDAV